MQKQLKIEFKPLIDMFREKGCPLWLTLSFINENFDYLNDHYDIFDKTYFIYNHDELYGLIIVDCDHYLWSINKEKEGFSPLKEVDTNSPIKDGDYIVEMMFRFADTEKVKKIYPQVEDMNKEEKVKILKEIGLNSKGYHFR